MFKKKIILVDWGHFSMASILGKNGLITRKVKLQQEGKHAQAKKMFIMPAPYVTMSMIIGNLKKIGVNADVDDRVIIACDSYTKKYHLSCYIEKYDTIMGLDLVKQKKTEETHTVGVCEYCQEDIYTDEQWGYFGTNWRKKLTQEYKGNRGEQRKQAMFIDWNKEFKLQNDLKDKLRIGTPFHVIEAPTLEADDLVAYGVRYYKDYECIILGQDHDYDQLLSLNNVKIFSPHSKVKLHPYRILDINRDKEREKAYKSLHSKNKKETADNLITAIETEHDYDIRNTVVNLLELPKHIIQKAKLAFDEIDDVMKSDFDITVFSNTIQKRFYDIYKTDKIITYDKCRQKLINKNKKKVKKEAVKCGT